MPHLTRLVEDHGKQGLNVLAIGGIRLTVDGREITLSDRLAYKGMMLSGVPNFALTVGYTNASWTLKADLVAGYVCRLLRYLAAGGYQTVTPVAPDLGLLVTGRSNAKHSKTLIMNYDPRVRRLVQFQSNTPDYKWALVIKGWTRLNPPNQYY